MQHMEYQCIVKFCGTDCSLLFSNYSHIFPLPPISLSLSLSLSLFLSLLAHGDDAAEADPEPTDAVRVSHFAWRYR